MAEESKSWMREAFNLTTQMLNSRIRRYKTLIISIGVVVIASIIWTIAWKEWSPLLCLILPVPLCGIFFSNDAGLISRWQNQILNLWIHDELDIGLFIDTISQVRMFPKHTLQSMLATLPSREIASNQTIEMKEALLITLQTINRCQIERIVFITIAFSLGLAFIALALIHLSWNYLFGLFLIPVFIIIGKIFLYARLQNWKRNIRHQNIDAEIFIKIADKLDWGTIHKNKEKFLEAIIK